LKNKNNLNRKYYLNPYCPDNAKIHEEIKIAIELTISKLSTIPIITLAEYIESFSKYILMMTSIKNQCNIYFLINKTKYHLE
jgi:hypothetical protein